MRSQTPHSDAIVAVQRSKQRHNARCPRSDDGVRGGQRRLKRRQPTVLERRQRAERKLADARLSRRRQRRMSGDLRSDDRYRRRAADSDGARRVDDLAAVAEHSESRTALPADDDQRRAPTADKRTLPFSTID